jgi:Helicase associated domain
LSQEKNNLVISSPVLQQVYPELLKYVEQYGHPNIPLGSKEGRQCLTLRRLHTQQKLTVDEVTWLESLGFTWHSLEDVYRFAQFDILFQRLVEYERRHPDSHFQVPKKCKEDPELGAWVTGLRRLGPDGVNPEHERRLEAIGFVWKSARQCGSKFMEQYRVYTTRVQEEGRAAVMAEESTVRWIKAQQEVMKKGNLSQTRVHYMGQLFGEDWTTV